MYEKKNIHSQVLWVVEVPTRNLRNRSSIALLFCSYVDSVLLLTSLALGFITHSLVVFVRQWLTFLNQVFSFIKFAENCKAKEIVTRIFLSKKILMFFLESDLFISLRFFPCRIGNFGFLVRKYAQCSETYANIIDEIVFFARNFSCLHFRILQFFF